jgi:hopene-associated glycosyltransferase HpnB
LTARPLDAAGFMAAAVWAFLLLFRGRFWRFREEPPPRPLSAAPSVCAIVPARNEAAVVGRAVASLQAQNYAGEFDTILVDDGSDDGTVARALEAAGPSGRLQVLRGQPPGAGWSGKLWAMAQGVRAAPPCDYLWFTDADIVHSPDNLAGLVARAESGYDLVSYMATLRCKSAAERTLIPAFVFFFFMLYPPAWIRHPRKRTAGAAGGCILIRRETLERAGGIARIRGELIDDCAMAQMVKRSGGRVWLGLSRGTESVREYGTFGSVGAMIARTAFNQLGYSALVLAGTVAGLALVFLGPPVLTFARSWLALAGWVMMSLAFAPAVRFYRLSLWRAPLLPLAAAFYMGCTVASAIQYWRGQGGRWKGRKMRINVQQDHE